MFYISFGGTMLGVRLEKDVEYRLNHLCDETGHTKSYYVKKAIKEFLDAKEDLLLGIAAIERNEPTITLDELERKLGLAG